MKLRETDAARDPSYARDCRCADGGEKTVWVFHPGGVAALFKP